MVSCYVTLDERMPTGELELVYGQYYEGEPFVELADRPPGVRDVRDTNIARIHAVGDERTGKAFVFCVIDNLWKGASSQAVQNLNLMLGLPETLGLEQ
jgi:N-acetyl-gamma-glutamyl-phosphate reductase